MMAFGERVGQKPLGTVKSCLMDTRLPLNKSLPNQVKLAWAYTAFRYLVNFSETIY
jgi:hypothetical protein